MMSNTLVISRNAVYEGVNYRFHAGIYIYTNTKEFSLLLIIIITVAENCILCNKLSFGKLQCFHGCISFSEQINVFFKRKKLVFIPIHPRLENLLQLAATL
jgi:hypothetical protein